LAKIQEGGGSDSGNELLDQKGERKTMEKYQKEKGK